MFQMLEETEEALIAIFVNQNIVSQVQVASAGDSRERKAENMIFYSAKYPPKTAAYLSMSEMLFSSKEIISMLLFEKA